MALGWAAMPDPVSLHPRQMEMIEGAAAAIEQAEREAKEAERTRRDNEIAEMFSGSIDPPSSRALEYAHDQRWPDSRIDIARLCEGYGTLVKHEARAEAWQPIETAPRDGTTVIVGRDMDPWGFVRGAGRWDGSHGIYGWVCRGFIDPPGELGLANPTHWQPMPEPPFGLRQVSR